jgi:predicted amidohydrolase YtcJ
MTNYINYHNGRIFTSNSAQPYAEAMAVRNGRIEWIGDDEKSKTFEGKRVDLQGRRFLPGFIEAHMHPLFLANTAK